jgi:CBS domain-containing protein
VPAPPIHHKEFDMTVQRILDRQPKRTASTITPDTTIAAALQSPGLEDGGALVVSSDGRTIEGIISVRDIVRGLKSIGPDLLNKSVRDLMTAKVLTCAPQDRAVGIMALMMTRHVHHVPVLTNGTLVGMVTVHDLLQLRLEEVLSEAEAMQKYIGGSG